MSKCRCGHEQGQHIYDEGLCRPGFICDCKSFSPAEPKCAECECGHGHTYLEIDGGLAPLMNQLCVSEGCDCESYRPAEPDATDEDFKIEPISQHTLKVPVQYKGQAEPLDFTEPDATERARAFAEACGYKWVGEMPYDRLPELFTSQLLAFLESETPRIKADAVREFVAEVEKEIVEPSDDDLFDGHQLLTTGSVLEVMRTVQARQVTKEMTEEVD